MRMAIAAFIGTSVGYTDYYNSVFIETTDGRAIVIDKTVFNELYYKLDGYNAAFKEDCIEYASNDYLIDLFEQPSWYIELVEDGVIQSIDCGVDIFYPESGEEITLDPCSVILRNRYGEFRYMEYEDFSRYYDVKPEE